MKKYISIIILAVLFSVKPQAQVSYNALYNLDFDAYDNKQATGNQ